MVLIGINAGKLRIIPGRVAMPDVDVDVRKGLAGQHVQNTDLENHRDSSFAIWVDSQHRWLGGRDREVYR